MAPLRKQVKNLDSYVKAVEKFYAVKANLIYKNTVNERINTIHLDTEEEERNIKIAAKALRHEIKQLPTDIVRPLVVEHMNEFLDNKFEIKES